MTKKKLKEGDALRHKKNPYGYMRFVRLVPKAESNTTYQVAEVLHSSNGSFDFALIKHFRLSDMEAV